MATVQKTIELPNPPEQVWQQLANPEATAAWNALHVGYAGEVPAMLSADDKFTQKVRILGMPGEVAWTVAEAEENSSLKLDGVGPMGTFLKQSFTLEAADGGTRLIIDNEFGGAALGPMEAAITQESDRVLTESLEKLKAALAG